ncbi:hypothetical protein BZM26_00890 [Paraburkholderia strydomiana]|nr:hypothetical protein BZM26_00890 [Paraburkholderia strydomiana]
MRKDVRFPSSGLSLAAHLYVPENASGPLPGIVIGHPMGAVKEQSPANYADRLVKQGFVVLTFDAAYQGDSEGNPHGLEDPFQRSEDVKSAVSYLSVQPEVDPKRIGALGICASGGYVPFAAQTDHRIKAVATVVAACVGILWRDGMDGKQSPAVIKKQLDEAAVDRTNEAKGEPVRMSQIVPATPEQAEHFPPKSMFREAYDYYCTPRAQHPRAANRWVARSVDKIAQYDSYVLVELIAPRPLLMIAGTEADTQRFSVETIKKAKGPKELFWIEGATHIDLYDKPQYVDPASKKVADFFHQHLGS